MLTGQINMHAVTFVTSGREHGLVFLPLTDSLYKLIN